MKTDELVLSSWSKSSGQGNYGGILEQLLMNSDQV